MYRVCQNHEAALICSFKLSLSYYQASDGNFRYILSVTAKSRELKLGTHVDSGWVYPVYRKHDRDAYLFHYFSSFLSLQFSD